MEAESSQIPGVDGDVIRWLSTATIDYSFTEHDHADSSVNLTTRTLFSAILRSLQLSGHDKSACTAVGSNAYVG